MKQSFWKPLDGIYNMKGFHSVLGWAHGRLPNLGLQNHGSDVAHEMESLRSLYNRFSILNT